MNRFRAVSTGHFLRQALGMVDQDGPQVIASSDTVTNGVGHHTGNSLGQEKPFRTQRSSGTDPVAEGAEEPQFHDKMSGHLVILVHGINTRALWMGEVKPALETSGFVVAPTSFGKFGILRFLMPFEWMRAEAIRRVAADIQTARRVYRRERGADPELMSVISHSFGTYVVSRILTDYSELKWNRVIFCGSVVREDFRFDYVLDRFDPPLLNEVGTKDFWPAVAESAGWGYGSVGSTGFNRPPVETRWHRAYAHSDFLTEEFCQTFWVPFLRGEKPIRGNKAAAMPLAIRMVTWVPLRLLPLIILISVSLIIVPKAFDGISQRHRDLTSTESNSQAYTVDSASQFSASSSLPSDTRKFWTGDPLQILDGVWITMNPPGEQLLFYRTSAGLHEVSFPRLGQATVVASDGLSGSNLKASGQNFDCYYTLAIIGNTAMTWEFKNGSPVCPSSMYLRREPLPR
jgi:pimeloyl-ACP methyl ester carboxylesterase